ncbi:MAG: nicotinate-nucleotide adenylyltransferase [Clostridia bacterium]|jgi:nicotinate-nucleotide adenylyltransferase|nr:nicotinate-nucleotide adenylyltransferase [Clostridia bacterium]MDD4502038.1 nicotinate-nucleotide adenylyltransferase [Clostridia bacterium]HPB16384.1 nicotinate-nucleotide adenylyltransferase [Clostridia bacterium]HQM95634.1 nicotinate-nucleotide adenylyltransferase [Clostridia bacterium]HQO70038.1 nicotinate-nucleotide adenylyltransferase [Clostridia bacterium]
MKLGILGATFDPVHKAHIQMAKYALDYCEYVLLTPCTKPPHKDNDNITEDSARYSMLCLALDGYERLIASDIELKRETTTYTIDTLRQVKNEYSVFDGIVYVIGADTLFQLTTWKEYEEVFKLCTFLVFERKGFSRQQIHERMDMLKKNYNADIIFDTRSVSEISSSVIRKAIVEGDDSIEWMLDKKVYRYILGNGIYK